MRPRGHCVNRQVEMQRRSGSHGSSDALPLARPANTTIRKPQSHTQNKTTGPQLAVRGTTARRRVPQTQRADRSDPLRRKVEAESSLALLAGQTDFRSSPAAKTGRGTCTKRRTRASSARGRGSSSTRESVNTPQRRRASIAKMVQQRCRDHCGLSFLASCESLAPLLSRRPERDCQIRQVRHDGLSPASEQRQ